MWCLSCRVIGGGCCFVPNIFIKYGFWFDSIYIYICIYGSILKWMAEFFSRALLSEICGSGEIKAEKSGWQHF